MPRWYAAITGGRNSTDVVLLEGLHPVKHALRFGAIITHLATWDRAGLASLATALAPDVKETLLALAVDVPLADASLLAPKGVPSPVIGVAARPIVTVNDVLGATGPVIVCENPRHFGNVGAVIRVAAAAGAGGVLIVGDADPWHPTAVRAAAGLQFALPVARCDELPETNRPIVALDGAGETLNPGMLDDAVLLVVGTERAGVTQTLRDRAVQTVALPMRPGVSSLNLATAVAAALYRGR
ncbi:MAG: TrmH family RNA methyltransferase [Nitriliruptoraceae bacterium]